MRKIVVEKNEAGQRIDRFLNKYLDKAPKSLIQKYIRKKRIKVNKKRVQADYMLEEGDLINIYIYDEVLNQYISNIDYKVFEESLDYVYQDDNIAIVYKDFGKIMYGENKSLVDVFISDLIKNNEFNPSEELSFTPSFANRLDRNTSGILVGCKNAESLRIMNAAFKDGKVERRYRTIVNGIIDKELEIENNLMYEKNNMVRVSEDRKGKKSKTIVKPIKQGKNYSLVDVNLLTGRKHQIRVHLASIGHPILGDGKYGKGEDLTSFGLKSQYLISYKIRFDSLEGELAYLSNKEFSLDESYYNKNIEKTYLSK